MNASANMFCARAARAVCLAAAGLLALIPLGAAAEQNFPLPVSVEGSYQKTTLYLALDAESPGQPLSQVAAAAGAGSAAAFAQQVVDVIETGNLAAFTALAAPGEADLAQILERYQVAFQATPDPAVFDIFRLGRLHYFALGVSHPDVPIAPLPILEATGGGFSHDFGALVEPVVQNVSALARMRQVAPLDYAAVASPGTSVTITLPPLFGSTGAFPVRLRFEGIPIPGNLLTTPEEKAQRLPAAAGAALDFYLDYRRAFSARDTAAMLAALAPRSRQKVARYVDYARQGDSRGEAMRRWLAQAPQEPAAQKSTPTDSPIYIILGGDLYLFFRPASVETLAFEYVRVGSSGLEVVNFHRQTPLDSLLYWPPVAADLRAEMPSPP